MSVTKGMPLSGVRVVDFTHHAAGPMCTMLLGDYGAEIIKIEPPEGEAFRTSGTVRVAGEHVGFLALNRAKKSVVLDLKTPEGKQAVLDIIAKSHVVVENFRPGTMERLGLGYEQLLEVHPYLVYCALSAFGPDGPYRDKQGLDVVLQAMSGLMSITGEPQGGPLPSGAPVADISSGVFGALGVVLAVMQARQTAKPQRVDIAMLDCMVALCNLRYQQQLATGEHMPRLGAAHPQASPWDVYHASDAPFVIAATRDAYWRSMCEGLGLQQHAHDPRFATIKSRVANRAEVNALLNELFRGNTRAHWLAVLDRAQVPNGPVNSLPDVAADAQMRHNETFVAVRNVDGSELTTIDSPIRINGRRGGRQGVPALGEHTKAVLAELAIPLKKP
jgi:crotonobetainyl-CoA:carnitine CoA-transferase CaiB-like acyl-CoA transferase